MAANKVGNLGQKWVTNWLQFTSTATKCKLPNFIHFQMSVCTHFFVYLFLSFFLWGWIFREREGGSVHLHTLCSASLKNNVAHPSFFISGGNSPNVPPRPGLMQPLNFSPKVGMHGNGLRSQLRRKRNPWLSFFRIKHTPDCLMIMKNSNSYWYSGSSPPSCLAEAEKKFHNRTLKRCVQHFNDFWRTEKCQRMCVGQSK